MIVEDHPAVALNLRVTIEQIGHEVLATTDRGERAIELAAALRPDLVLMDIGLSGELDGVRTASLLRERLGVPCVFVSASGDEETLQRARAAEPLGYLFKPYDERLLGMTIELALYRAAAEHQRELMAVERQRAEKAEAVARLAVRVAHEVNNLLSAIGCNAYLLESEAPAANDEAREAVSEITAAVGRGAALTADLLRLARDSRRAPTPVENADLIQSTAALSEAMDVEPERGAPATGRFTPVPQPSGDAGVVLLVEGDAGARASMNELMTGWGYRVLCTDDAFEATALASRERLDVLVVATALSRMDGRELARRVRAMQPRAGLVYVGAEAGAEAGGKSDPATADVVLRTPFAPALLREALARVTEARAADATEP